MQPKVREALEASIKHWEENVAAKTSEEAKVFGDSCALCKLFSEPYEASDPDDYRENCGHPSFGKCPVFSKTGKNECGGSPWETAMNAWRAWNPQDPDFLVYWQKVAQAELDFLCSLRED